MHRLGITVAIAAVGLAAVAVSGSAQAQQLAPGFATSVAIDHLDLPVGLAFAPTGEVFVGEKAGLVKRFAPLPSPGPGTVILDIRDQVASFQDRGLMAIAVHPGYPLVPYVYVLYTYDAPPGQLAPVWHDTCGAAGQPDPASPGGGCVASGRLVRYTLMGDALVDETVLIANAWYQQYGGHTVGDLAFGPDGELFVSAGEGASYRFPDDGDASMVSTRDPNPDDPPGEGGSLRALDVLTAGDPVGLSGTVLRLDPITGAAAADNPLPGDAARIIAFGLRNPFRIAFRPGTRELWIADVGANAYEEIDRIADVDDGVVEDFGWPCFEGGSAWFASEPLCTQLAGGTLPAGTPGTLTPPVTGYLHGRAPGFDATPNPCVSSDGNSIVGVGFLSDAAPPRLRGALVYADYSVRCLYAQPLDASGAPDGELAVIGRALPRPITAATGPNGDLYFAAAEGKVMRVRYIGSAPVAIATASATSGVAPLAIDLDGSASSDPDGEPLAYAWDLDGDGAFDDAATAHVAQTLRAGTHIVRLRVTDSDGEVTVSDPLSIAVRRGPADEAADRSGNEPADPAAEASGSTGGGCDAGGSDCSYVVILLLTLGRFGLTNWSYQSCPSPSSNRNRKSRPPRSTRCSRSCSRTSSAASTPPARGCRRSAS